MGNMLNVANEQFLPAANSSKRKREEKRVAWLSFGSDNNQWFPVHKLHSAYFPLAEV